MYNNHMISIDDFAKIELRVGKVLSAEPVEGSEKLLKLSVDMGDEQPRQVLSGIAKWYTPEDLIGNSYIFVANLEPRMMMGLESQGMIMAAENDDAPVLLITSSETAPGAKIK